MARPKSIISKADLARTLKLSKARVTQLYKLEGFPTRPDGRVDRAKAIQWYEASGLKQTTKSGPRPTVGPETRDDSPADDQHGAGPSKLDLEKQKLTAEVEALALKNQKERGSLILASEVFAAQFQRASAEKEALLNWPAAISAGVAARLGCAERDVFLELDREVRLHLEQRSSQPETAEAAARK